MQKVQHICMDFAKKGEAAFPPDPLKGMGRHAARRMQNQNQGHSQERTIAEYVQEYSINRFTLNKAIKRQSLPSRKSGGTHLIKQSDFDAWHTKYLQSPRVQKKQNKFSENSEIAQKNS
jgi:hypothetical protein